MKNFDAFDLDVQKVRIPDQVNVDPTTDISGTGPSISSLCGQTGTIFHGSCC